MARAALAGCAVIAVASVVGALVVAGGHGLTPNGIGFTRCERLQLDRERFGRRLGHELGMDDVREQLEAVDDRGPGREK